MKPAPNRYFAVGPGQAAGRPVDAAPAGEKVVAAGRGQHQPVGRVVQAAVLLKRDSP